MSAHTHRTPSALLWLRKNLFSTPGNSLLTVVTVLLLASAAAGVADWVLLDARWSGTSSGTCRNVHGACWPFIWAHLDQFMYGNFPVSERWRIQVGISLGVALAVLASLRFIPGRRTLGIALFTAYPLVAAVLFAGGAFGLAPVSTSLWGGFFLTIVVSFCVLTLSLPLGILLALGRRSQVPLVRTICAAWVELWRAVPAVVLLFVMIIMFPLFMPQDVEVDKLLRAMLALTLLMSAYIAEVVRGSLQALARGQYEAASALGLNYPQATLLVVLPQALSAALPQIASQFIGLFKETTVLLIVGFFDLLGMVQVTATDPDWFGASTTATGYVFAAAFYWVCCFSMSRFSARLEERRAIRPAGVRAGTLAVKDLREEVA